MPDMDLDAVAREFVHRHPPGQHVHVRAGGAFALDAHLADHGARRALLLAGPRMPGALIDAVVAGAGGRIVSSFRGVAPHAPLPTVDAAVARAREVQADGLVSLGGGSTHDTARAVALSLQTGLPFLDHFRGTSRSFIRHIAADDARDVPLVAVPSTLSAAETTFGGGVTHGARKLVFIGESLYVRSIVLDREVFDTTPLDVLLSTGMNALNHAVERLTSPARQPIADAGFLHALRLLMPGLEDLGAGPVAGRSTALEDCMLGAHLSSSTNVFGGVGHAIAHVLGGRYAVAHGVANGIVLPHAVRLAARLEPASTATLETELGVASADGVADALTDFVERLRLPGRLRDVGIARGDLEGIGPEVLEDFSAAAARQGLTLGAVAGVLRAAW